MAKIDCDQFDLTRSLSIILGEPGPRAHHQPDIPSAFESVEQAA
jgi:hypothetical protein